jgi:hypothetical protein
LHITRDDEFGLNEPGLERVAEREGDDVILGFEPALVVAAK